MLVLGSGWSWWKASLDAESKQGACSGNIGAYIAVKGNSIVSLGQRVCAVSNTGYSSLDEWLWLLYNRRLKLVTRSRSAVATASGMGRGEGLLLVNHGVGGCKGADS